LNLSLLSLTAGVAGSLLAGSALAAGDRNVLPAAGGAFLTYVNNPASRGAIEKSPELKISVGGNASVAAVMDTGSTGIVISEDAIVDASQLIRKGDDSITYSSSGKIMSGWRAEGVVTITGANGQGITTETIPMLVVTRISCVKNARHCQDGQSISGIAMIGIGFGREGTNGSGAFTPERNPFLHVAGQAGELRSGYVVTRQGVQVGVTPQQVSGTDFALTHLQRDEAHPGDWQPQSVAMTLTGTELAVGTVLVDTGVSDMYLTLPYDMTAGKTVEACEVRHTGRIGYGAEACAQLQGEASDADDFTSWTSLAPKAGLAIGISTGSGAADLSASYGFAVGDGGATTPNRVLLVGNLAAPVADEAAKTPFVNTSVKLLNGFDYLFDGDDGLIGYHPDPAPAPSSVAAQ